MDYDMSENSTNTGGHAQAFSKSRNTAIHNSTFNVVGGDMYQGTDRMDAIDELREVANWLTLINFRILQSDTLSRRTPDTGNWFINCPEFQEWLEKNVGVLWVTGMPGAGKTVLSSIIIDYLERLSSEEQGIAVVFMYCRYTDPRSVMDLLASLVKQLTEHHSSIFQVVKDMYNTHRKEETRPSEEKLLELLQKLLPLFKKVFIVLDALDKATDDTKFDLLTTLSSLQAVLLVTSRPLDLFKGLLQDAVHVYIETQNQEDIELFVVKKNQGSPHIAELLKSKELLNEVCTKIKEKSKGMFLLAVLQIESLKSSTTVKKLCKALELLPSGIDAMYQSTLERINAQTEEEASLAKQAITWVTYAYQSLTITELQHGLAVSYETEIFDEEDIASEKQIISVCCGLIAVDEWSRDVGLVYYTAHDFFKRVSLELISTPHAYITTCCIAYLSTLQFTKQKISSWTELQQFLGNKPLLIYAYHHWGSHAYACNGEAGLQNVVSKFVLEFVEYPFEDDDIEFDQFKPSHLASYYGLLDSLPAISESWNQPTTIWQRTPLILASQNGHEVVVKLLFTHNEVSINKQDKYGDTALILASGNRHEAVVRLLLSYNEVIVNIQNEYGNTALFVASENGHEAITKLLLFQNKADINAQNKYGNTMLILASRGGHKAVVKLLLSHNEVALNIQNEYENTALIVASQNGYEAVAKLLLSQNKVVINTQNKSGNTVLMVASGNGHEAVVKLLLSHIEVAINTQNKYKNTALMQASRNGHEAVVRLLLSHNEVAINTQDEDENTALILASRNGHEAVVRLLLFHNEVAINIQDKDRNTAFILASWNGHEAVVRLLLSYNKVTVNAQNKCRNTALILASWKGHEAVVKLLLSHNEVAVNMQNNNDGDTALIIASRSGYEAVVKLLLSHNEVAVNMKNNYQETALIPASWKGHEAIVKLLLSHNEVVINTQNKYENTALIVASCNGHEAVIKLLLSYNEVAVNMQDNSRDTALIIASCNGHEAVVKLLLSHNNITVNVHNKSRNTALILASQNGHEAVVKLLLSYNDVTINKVGLSGSCTHHVIKRDKIEYFQYFPWGIVKNG